MIKERYIKAFLLLVIVSFGVSGLRALIDVIDYSESIVYAQSDPNIPSVDPNAINLPEDAKMPVRLKCPVHGIIGRSFIIIETDAGTEVYCARCAKTFVAKVFNLNLPKLEIVK